MVGCTGGGGNEEEEEEEEKTWLEERDMDREEGSQEALNDDEEVEAGKEKVAEAGRALKANDPGTEDNEEDALNMPDWELLHPL
jgi:hypothetical protein